MLIIIIIIIITALERRKTEVMEKRWQGKLLAARWEEDQLNQRGCFALLKDWDAAHSHHRGDARTL